MSKRAAARTPSESPRSALERTLKLHLRAWYLFAIALALSLAGLIVAVLVAYALMRPLLISQIREFGNGWQSITFIAVEFILVMVILAVAAAMVWLGAVAQISDDLLSSRSPSLFRSLWIGVRRMPRSFAAVALAMLGFLGVVLVTPLLVVAGILGLIVAPVGKRFRQGRWPATKTLLILAIPFLPAILLALHWSLVIPVSTLERVSPGGALRRSGEVVGSHRRAIALMLAGALAVFLVVQTIFAAVGQLIDGERGSGVGQLAAQFLIGALPVVAATVAYAVARTGGGFLNSSPRPSFGAALGLVPTGLLASLARFRMFSILILVQASVIAVVPVFSGHADHGTLPPRVELHVPDGTGEVPLTVASIQVGSPVTIRVNIDSGLCSCEVPFGDEPTGTAAVSIDSVPIAGSPLAVVQDPGTGRSSVEFTHTFTTSGNHDVGAVYSGDHVWQSGSALDTITVAPQSFATSLALAGPASSVFGNEVIFTATVTAAGTALVPNGTVVFSVDDVATANIAVVPGATSGVATWAVSNLTVGDRAIKAVYQADALFDQSLPDSRTHAVSAATTAVTIDTPASPTLAGFPITIAITVDATDSPGVPVGTVTLKGGPSGFDTIATGLVLDTSGNVTVSPTLEPGDHLLLASYTPGAGFLSSVVTRPHEVIRNASTTTLVSSGNPTVFGEALTLTATVDSPTAPGTPTGTVSFLKDGVDLFPLSLRDRVTLDASGQAVLSGVFLPVGSHSLSARYGGDAVVGDPGILAGSDSPPLVQAVNRGPTDVQFGFSPSPVIFGDTVTINVTVVPVAPAAGSPSGTVDLTRDGVAIATVTIDGSGKGSTTVTGLVLGPHDITGVYSGDASFEGDSTTETLTVEGVPSSTFLSPSSQVVQYDQVVTFSALVRGSRGLSPSGQVELLDRSGTVLDTQFLDSRGRATFSISTSLLSPLENSLVARYVPDDPMAPSQSSSVRLRVEAAVTIVDLTWPGNPVSGEPFTLTATITGGVTQQPAGEVRFYQSQNTRLGAAEVVGGTASITVVLSPSTSVVWAEFVSRNTLFYEHSTSALKPILVDRAATVVDLSVSPNPADYGQTVTIRATLSASGPDVPRGTVTFRSPAGFFHQAQAIAGVAEFTACAGNSEACLPGSPVLSIRQHDITASYGGDRNAVAADSQVVSLIAQPARTSVRLNLSPAARVQAGSALIINAFVEAEVAPLSPDGRIVFYAVTSGGALQFLEGITLDTLSHAQLTLTAGQDFDMSAVAIRADYFPTSGFPTFARSSVEAPLIVDKIPVRVSISSVRPIAGQPALVGATVRPFFDTGDSPTGTLTLTSDTGDTCVATLRQTADSASCQLTWLTAGSGSVSASYSGDTKFESGSGGPTVLLVDKGSTVIGLVPNPFTQWTVGEPVTVSFTVFGNRIGGPVITEGDVAVLMANRVLCETTAASNSCTGRFPISATGAAATIDVIYRGSSTWHPSNAAATSSVLGCSPLFVGPAASIQGSGTVNESPNCTIVTLAPDGSEVDGGAGYKEGTRLTLVATVNDPFSFTGWDDGSTRQTRVIVKGPATEAYNVEFNRACVPLTIAAFGPLDPTTAQPTLGGGRLNIIQPTQLICGGDFGFTTDAAGRQTTLLPTGTSVTIAANPSFNDFGERNILYGYNNSPAFADGDQFTFTLTTPTEITAFFGPNCYQVTTDATGPGTATIETPPNCFDFSNPEGPGYHTGSVLEIALDGTHPAAYPVSIFNRDHGPLSPPFSAQHTVIRGGQFSVAFDRCYEATLEIRGDGNGRVERFGSPTGEQGLPPGDCPLQLNGTWFKPASDNGGFARRIMLEAIPAGDFASIFSRWEGNGESAFPTSQTSFIDIHLLRMDQDRRAVAVFMNRFTCSSVTAQAMGTGAGPVTWDDGDRINDCGDPNQYNQNPLWHFKQADGSYDYDYLREVVYPNYDRLRSPAILRFEASPPPGFAGLISWAMEQPSGGPVFMDNDVQLFGAKCPDWSYARGAPVRCRFDYTTGNQVLETEAAGDVIVTAWFCQGIDITVDLHNDIDGGSDSFQGVFADPMVTYDPPPDCPFQSTAWAVGTSVNVTSALPPESFTLFGGSGGVAQADGSRTILLDGMSNRAPVTLDVRATCHRLRLGSYVSFADPDRPDCPGATPAAFVHGSMVVMEVSVPSDKRWGSWTGDFDVTEGFSALVYMDAPKSVSVSLGDQAWYEDVGDFMANVAKKTVGALAFAGNFVMQNVFPMPIVSGMMQVYGLAMEGVAAIADAAGSPGLGDSIRSTNNSVQQSYNMLSNTLSCISDWGFGSSSTPPPGPPVPGSGGGITATALEVTTGVDQETAVLLAQKKTQVKATGSLIKKFVALRQETSLSALDRTAEGIAATAAPSQPVALFAKLERYKTGRQFKATAGRFAAAAGKAAKVAGAALQVGTTIYKLAQIDYGTDNTADEAFAGAGDWIGQCMYNTAVPDYMK